MLNKEKLIFEKGYGLQNIFFRSTFSLQYGHVCFLPTMHHPRIQNSWNLVTALRKLCMVITLHYILIHHIELS